MFGIEDITLKGFAQTGKKPNINRGLKKMITKQRFRRYKLDNERDNKDDEPFTLRLTDKDKVWFNPAKAYIKQPKKSTAMKQLAELGAMVVLHDKKTAKILEVLGGNLRRNEGMGIPESEYIPLEIKANVTQLQPDL